MYKLYYKRGSCSLAINALLRELGQEFELIDYADVADYKESINAAGSVPVLVDGDLKLAEGAAICIYLLEKHGSDMLPKDGAARATALYWLMFANASMHPSYSKIFFANREISDDAAKAEAMAAAAQNVSRMWAIADAQLAKTKFLCGDKPSAAEFLLTIYANWGAIYPDLPIEFGANVKRMLGAVSSLPSFQSALNAEKVRYKAV